MNLDDKGSWEKLDTMGVEKALALFPDQIKECFKQAWEFDIPKLTPKSILITGMGGSSNAAKILQGVYEDELKIPLIVHNDYGLPAWVDKDTLVVANSYSGNTEETLSGVARAKEIGAQVLGVATGGKIGEMVKNGDIHGAVVTPGDTNPPNFPKSGLGVSFGALSGVLAKAGIIDLTLENLSKDLDEVLKARESWLSSSETKSNEAKEVSVWLADSIPALFSGRPLVGALNAGRNVMCEVGRTFSLFFDFPEVNHVLVEAMAKPGFIKEKIKYLIFESNLNHERVKLRYDVTESILKEQGLLSRRYKLKTKTKLAQALEIPHFCAWLGFYLSILNGDDPGPEPWILKLKDALSQPLH